MTALYEKPAKKKTHKEKKRKKTSKWPIAKMDFENSS